MNLAVSIIAVAGSVLALLTASPIRAKHRRLAAHAAVAAGWVGVLVAVGGVYFGIISGLSTLVGAAACGGLAVLPAGIRLDTAREYGTALGGVMPLVAGVAGLFVESAPAVTVSEISLLYVAYFGAMGAALVCALVGCVLSDAAKGTVDGTTEDDGTKGAAPGIGTLVAIVAFAGAGLVSYLLHGGFAGRPGLPDLLPELSLWSAAALVVLFGGLYWRRLRGAETSARFEHLRVYSLHGRDYALRAMILVWLVVLLGGLIHWNHFGSIGVASPAEWNAVGAALVTTGLVLLGWTRQKTKLDTLLRQLAPAALFAVLVITVVVSMSFDAPFGLSIVF